MDEKSFIENVRSSLHGRRTVPAAALPLESLHVRSDPAEMVEGFVRELEATDGIVYRAKDLAEARTRILEIVAQQKIQSVVRANNSFERELEIDAALADAGVAVTVGDLRGDISRENIRDAEFEAAAGITSVDYGIAETGTLAVMARPGQGRAISLLCPVHIAILRSGQIVSDLSVLIDRIRIEREELPSALTFITGPSRTADIELVLTVGVHGPKELHVVVLEE
jgi:L-lactate dehydrogenase complex protein LldG